MRIKNVISTLMLMTALFFISACSSDDENNSNFRYNPSTETSQVSWVTPNSVAIKGGTRSIVLLSSEKTLLENVENAYNMALSSDSETVWCSEYSDEDHIRGCLFYRLKPNTTYYYVSLVHNSVDDYFSYGDIGSFMTDEPISEIVDLGLSVKWRGWNLDANNPYDRGYGYMWGYTNAGYIKNPNYPQESSIVGTKYDAAKVQLGGNWRMPTKAECEELTAKCTFQKVSCYNEADDSYWYGIYVTGPSGKHLFIPMTWTLTVNDYYELDYFNTCCFWIGESDISNGDKYYFSGYNEDTFNSSFGEIKRCYKNWELPIKAVME